MRGLLNDGLSQARLNARIEWHEDALAHLWAAYDRAAALEDVADMLSLSSTIAQTKRDLGRLLTH